MSDPRKPGPITIERCVAAWQRINHALQADDVAADEEALVGMFRAVDPHILTPDELLGRFIAAIAFAEAREDEAKSFAAAMKAREYRYRDRAAAMRSELLDVMQALDRKSFTGSPFGSASVQGGYQSAVPTDLEKIPDEYWKVEKTLRQRELTAALKAGKEIDGAVLSNPVPFLVLRTAGKKSVDESHLVVDETESV